MLEKTYSIIKESKITFDTELSKDYVSDGTKALIKNCSVLMLPLENFRKQSPLCFNEGFRNLFFYLKENLPENSVELCIDKEKIEEIALHSAEFHLGKFLIENIKYTYDLKKTYEGFTFEGGKAFTTSTQEGSNFDTTTTVLGDKSRVINMYYSRNKYKVELDKDEGISSVLGAGEYFFEAVVTLGASLNPTYQFAS